MKRFLRIMALVCAFCILLTLTAFANGETSPVTVTADFDGVYKFVEINTLPDITTATVTATYADGSTDTLTLDESYLPADLDTSVPGRLLLPITAFDVIHELELIVLDSSLTPDRFADFNSNYWGYTKIARVVKAGFFKGVSDTEFGVADNITRAQFCQMLYNIYKNDSSVMNTATQISFTDVNSADWFYTAVMTCAESGIVNGVGDGIFEPLSPITRQDAALMMMRILLGAEGINAVDVETTLAAARTEKGIAASDFDTASEYAKPALAAALGVIYYGDTDGNITPLSNITRAEAAAMISNLFFDGYVDPEPPPPPPAPVEKYLVYLSPERGPNRYTGVDTTEHDQMQIVAEKMKPMLEEMGYEVVIAKRELTVLEADGYERQKEAKALGADAYIALHTNATGRGNSGKSQGCICFYNGNNEGAKELSQAIYDNISALTPTTDGGSRNDMLTERPFAEVRLPEMANVLIEVEFHDYAPYANWIVNNTDNIAKNIANGIDTYFKNK